MHTKAKRTGHAGEVIVVAALALAVTMILRLTTPFSPAAAETGAPDTDDRFFTDLANLIVPGMNLGECGPEQASEVQALADIRPEEAGRLNFMAAHVEIYSEEAVRTALKNPEKLDFILMLPFQAPDDSGLDARIDLTEGIPYISQFDSRWAYHAYGSGVIGMTGCGPTCLAMAVAGLTGNADANPARIADFAEANGYYAAGTGTMWSLFTEGAAAFGLVGSELPLDENVIRAAIDGGVVVASMLTGDFTDTGHFIVIYAYDGQNFHVHDPNSAELSSRTWSYSDLAGQIANLWSLRAA